MKTFNLMRTWSILILTATGLSLYSQRGVDDGSKFGHGEDSIRCIRNLSLYREYAKQDNYKMALSFWKLVFAECPTASKNIYIDGIKIYKSFLDEEKVAQRQTELLDTILIIYDQRIKYYGEKGEVTGRKGTDLLKYCDSKDNAKLKQGYDLLKESLDLEKENSSNAVIGTYIAVSLTLYNSNVIDAGRAIQDYLLLSSLLDTKLTQKSDDQNVIDLKKAVDDNFVKDGPGSCQTLIDFFSKEYKVKKKDIAFLQMLTSLLRSRDCTESELFYSASKDLYTLMPSAESALNIARTAYNNGKYSEAITYYTEAIEREKQQSKKADYYFGVASSYGKLNNNGKAKDNALKAASLNPGWGEPYILIGQLYADSKNECSSISLPNAIYWAAVDQFVKAKKVDGSVADRANKLISAYSKYYPNKEEAFFLNVTEGSTYSIGCWINETTSARFSE